MKGLLACVLLLVVGEDPRRGLELLAAGKPAEAAEVFAAALRERPEDPELHYNHALALWRAGQPDAAEAAAERAAAYSDGRLAALRDGIVGNLRFEQSVAREQQAQPNLAQALALAEAAREHFERGALREHAPAELARNLERTLARIAELEQKLEEEKKEQEEQRKQEPEQKTEPPKQDEQQQQNEQKQNEQQQGEEQQNEQQQQPQQQPSEQPKDPQDPQQQPAEQPQPGESEPDPTQEPREPEERKPQDQQRKPGEDPDARPAQPQDSQQQPPPAPGELDQAKELTPEQRARLLEVLKQLEAQRERLREAQKARRPQVERDW